MMPPAAPPTAAPAAAPATVATSHPAATTGPTPGIASMPRPASNPAPPPTTVPNGAPVVRIVGDNADVAMGNTGGLEVADRTFGVVIAVEEAGDDLARHETISFELGLESPPRQALLANDVALIVEGHFHRCAVLHGLATPDRLIVQLQIRDVGVTVGGKPVACLGFGETVGAGNRGCDGLGIDTLGRYSRRIRRGIDGRRIGRRALGQGGTGGDGADEKRGREYPVHDPVFLRVNCVACRSTRFARESSMARARRWFCLPSGLPQKFVSEFLG